MADTCKTETILDQKNTPTLMSTDAFLIQSGSGYCHITFADLLDLLVDDTCPPVTALTGNVWDYGTGENKTVTLTNDLNLSITNATSGCCGTLIVCQDATGGHVLTVNGIVVENGAGVVNVSPLPNSKSLVSWFYDGADFFWNYGINYT